MTQHRADRAAQPAIAVVAIDQGNPACGIIAGDTRCRPTFERPIGNRKVPTNHALLRCGARRSDPLEAIIGVEDTKLGWGDLQAVSRLAVACVQALSQGQAEVKLGLQSALA